jgi:hypothetical protein
MTTPDEAVIAGSKGFALALLAPLTERVGIRPRVAADVAQALALCNGTGLVVVEYQGDASFRAIQVLRQQYASVRIVAAIPAEHAAAEAPLRSLGVELARWDGKPDAVLGAVSRQLAPAASAPSPAPAAAQGPRPPPPGMTAVASAPAPAPRPAPSARPPAQAAPPATRPAGGVAPVVTAPPAAAPRPAPAASHTKGPPVVASRQPAAAKPVAAAPVPSAAAAAHVAPAPAPALASPAPPVPAAPPGAEQPAAGAGLGDDAGGWSDVQLDLSEDPSGPALSAPPALAGGAWPSNVPGPIESADALGRGLAGKLDPRGTPFGSVAEVIAHLTELEHAVLSGAPQPIDTEAIRRAAVMRVRVAVALATAPAPGGEVDAGAVSALLGDIDALLSEVNALAAAASPEVQPALEQVRNALVKEAIDFSEAAHRVQPAEPIPAAESQPAAPRGRAAQTRIVSVATKAELDVEKARQRRHRRLYVLLFLTAIGAAGFHGYRYAQRIAALQEERPRRPGMPANAGVVDPPRGAGRVLIGANDGRAFSAEELQRLREEEALRGNTVREIGPGAVVVLPEKAGATIGAPAAAPTSR